jgi:hypothetical protein
LKGVADDRGMNQYTQTDKKTTAKDAVPVIRMAGRRDISRK